MKAADKTLSKRYARAYMGLDGAAFDRHGEAAAALRMRNWKKSGAPPAGSCVCSCTPWWAMTIKTRF